MTSKLNEFGTVYDLGGVCYTNRDCINATSCCNKIKMVITATPPALEKSALLYSNTCI